MFRESYWHNLPKWARQWYNHERRNRTTDQGDPIDPHLKLCHTVGIDAEAIQSMRCTDQRKEGTPGPLDTGDSIRWRSDPTANCSKRVRTLQALAPSAFMKYIEACLCVPQIIEGGRGKEMRGRQ